MKSRWDAGQYKLNGRKEKLLACKCCTILDLREEYLIERVEKELREYSTDTGVAARGGIRALKKPSKHRREVRSKGTDHMQEAPRTAAKQSVK